MSYGVAAALQVAVFDRLRADAALQALIGDAVHDAVPPGTPPGTYVLLGPEEVADRSDITGAGAEHRLKVAVISAAAGFQAAKEVAGVVSDALCGATLPLARGRVVGLWFERAVADRVPRGGARRIALTFRVRVED